MKANRLDVPVTVPLDAETVEALQQMADETTEGNRSMLIRSILRKAVATYQENRSVDVTSGCRA